MTKHPDQNIPLESDVEFQERVVSMARIAKVVKGGRRFSFNALTVVGDFNSYVGLGFGKAKEIPEAVRKSIEDGKKNLIRVEKQNSTIPHKVIGKFKSARVLLKPGAPGTGIIAGEAVRAIVELGGIQDILTKRFGSSNKLNIVKATLNALKQLNSPNTAKQRRDISLPELFGPYSKKRKEEKIMQRQAEETKVSSASAEAIISKVEDKVDEQTATDDILKEQEIKPKDVESPQEEELSDEQLNNNEEDKTTTPELNKNNEEKQH